ncbi:hypothetical protein [Oligoflexus tunisiensis]|nr:hypothetical protein [Oligoflexus tunisiensis]
MMPLLPMRPTGEDDSRGAFFPQLSRLETWTSITECPLSWT